MDPSSASASTGIIGNTSTSSARILDNPSPLVCSSTGDDSSLPVLDDESDALRDEVFSLIRYIQDPEHQLTLEQLGVVKKKHISISSSSIDTDTETDTQQHIVTIQFIPTVPHCSLARLIGLCIRTVVEKNIPEIKVDVEIVPVNKQLADKERCCAALEQPILAEKVKELISNRPE